MPNVSMTVTGDAELNRKLAALKGVKQKQAVRKASRESLKPLAAATSRAAPRDSGLLARSVKVRALKRSRTRVGARVSVGDGKFKGQTFYGGFVELGRKTGKRGSVGRRRVEPNDFIRRAARQKKQSVLADYKQRLRRLIIQLAREG